jgi:hypothetical protein
LDILHRCPLCDLVALRVSRARVCWCGTGSRVFAWRRMKVVPFKGRVGRWAIQELRLWEGLYREPTPAGSVRHIKNWSYEGRFLEALELHQTKEVNINTVAPGPGTTTTMSIDHICYQSTASNPFLLPSTHRLPVAPSSVGPFPAKGIVRITYMPITRRDYAGRRQTARRDLDQPPFARSESGVLDQHRAGPGRQTPAKSN